MTTPPSLIAPLVAPLVAPLGAPQDPPGASAAPMLTVLLNLLTPLLAAGGLTDPALARRAAADALSDYRARAEGQLLSAAQLLGYGVAGLDLLQIAARSAAPLVEQAGLRNAAARLAVMSARAGRVLAMQQGEAACSASAAREAAFEVQDVAEETAALAELQATTERLREVRGSVGHDAVRQYSVGQPRDEARQTGARPPESERVLEPARLQEPERPQSHNRHLDPQRRRAWARSHLPGAPHDPALAPAPARAPPPIASPAPDRAPKPAANPAWELDPSAASAPRPGSSPPVRLPAGFAARTPLTPAEERVHKLMWAGAMTQVAQESAAHLPTLPAPQRRIERIRITALSTVARGLTDAAHLLPRVVPPSGPIRPG
jgi:hypothetical protein